MDALFYTLLITASLALFYAILGIAAAIDEKLQQRRKCNRRRLEWWD